MFWSDGGDRFWNIRSPFSIRFKVFFYFIFLIFILFIRLVWVYGCFVNSVVWLESWNLRHQEHCQVGLRGSSFSGREDTCRRLLDGSVAFWLLTWRFEILAVHVDGSYWVGVLNSWQTPKGMWIMMRFVKEMTEMPLWSGEEIDRNHNSARGQWHGAMWLAVLDWIVEMNCDYIYVTILSFMTLHSRNCSLSTSDEFDDLWSKIHTDFIPKANHLMTINHSHWDFFFLLCSVLGLSVYLENFWESQKADFFFG